MAEPASGSKAPTVDLAGLEQAFAKDPTSDAYRPLAEAYLQLGRFMEAMVVAKKGAKARTTEAAPRLVLARIYAEQSKFPRALEELALGLQAQPDHLDSLKLQAQLFFKTQQPDRGAGSLLRALELAPHDAEIAQLMAKFSVKAPAPVAATAPAAIALNPGAVRVVTPLDAQGRPIPRELPRSAQGASLNPSGPSQAQIQAQAAYQLARLADEEERVKRSGSGGKALLSFGLMAVILFALGGWYLYGKHRNARDHEIAALLKKTQDALARDSYVSYQDAEKTAQRALELDPANFAADAYLAYINALRFGENGEGEEYLKRARDYLAAAKAQQQPHAYIFAAEAYILSYSQKPEAAESELSEILNRKDSAGGRLYTSNLLSGSLGILQLQSGKLSEARKNLVEAHTYAPADVRVTAALGTVEARLSSRATAESFFQSALKVDADHAPSLLGLALLLLEGDPPDASGAERALSHLSALGPGVLSPRQASFAKFLHAQLLYAQNKLPAAAEEESGALALDPRNAEMLLIAGRRLRRAGQPDKAIGMIRQAIEIDPNRGSFYAELGETYLAVPNGAAAAIPQLKLAVERASGNPRLVELLAEAYHRQGDAAQAEAQWQRVLKLDPDNAASHLGLARSYAQRGDSLHAESEYQAAARRAAGPQLAEIDTELGRSALDRGDASKARELFNNALVVNPAYPPPYFYTGKLLVAERGRKPQARSMFAEYLKRAPTGPLAADARRLMR